MDNPDLKHRCDSPQRVVPVDTMEVKKISDFSNLYKTSSYLPLDQVQRREKLLRELKERRNNVTDKRRGILELLSEYESERNVNGIDSEPMEVCAQHRKHRKSGPYAYKLMLSEWFTEIPFDLETSWLVKLCPVGCRNLVVAYKNITKAFSRYGEEETVFVSCLPGGGPNSNFHVFTVLDCIFNKNTKTYYVLDVIAWNSQSVSDCDTEFRFYWLKFKLLEHDLLRVASKFNTHPFVAVDYMLAELHAIEEAFSKPYRVNGVELLLDGILFYHSQAHYASGRTPLVGWLKPYMIPEMLHVPVHDEYLAKQPKNYKSLQEYLQYVEGLRGRQRKRHMKSYSDVTEMETEIC